MKNLKLSILFFFLTSLAFGAEITPISKAQISKDAQLIKVGNTKKVYYQENGSELVFDLQGAFIDGKLDSISFNDSIIYKETSNFYTIKGVDLAEHSFAFYGNGKKIGKGSFKFKEKEPLIKNDAVVLGLLLLILALIFKSEASNIPFFKKFYGIVPALLLCYFVPAFLNSFGLISADESKLYFVASRYLLPASLVLLCLSIDLKGIKRLGPKALIMFFTATVGIMVGGPIALYLVSLMAPEVLNGEIWRGLATVAGSWIGGGANQTAMKEIYGSSDQLFSAMIVVDVFVANLFMSVLLFGTGYNKQINKFFKADDSAIENLKNSMESLQKKIAKVATFRHLIYVLTIAFAAVGLSHFLADNISPLISDWLDGIKDSSPLTASLLTSFGSHFFWLVVLSTIFGITLSFTKARDLEGVGASKIGSIFLYVLVATIGMKMDIFELVRNWGVFKFLITIGLIWITIHAIFLFVVAKIIKAPFFYVAVGSQANVGGAASAPVVAAAFSPSLAPVGVLLAVLGYAVGTFGAIGCAMMMQYLTV